MNKFSFLLMSEIFRDLYRNNKLIISLFILIIITAIYEINWTNNTRNMNIDYAEQEQKIKDLEVENKNLRLEKANLTDTNKIETIARKKLKMEPTKIDFELD